MISLIWAMDQNWLIGKDNRLPWHYPKDLAFFKQVTIGKTVLMGEQTYLSLKGYYKDKPLPFAKIYIATLENKTFNDGITVNDVVSFLEQNQVELFVIGGAVIYKLALPFADYLYITFILNQHSGNVYFPKLDLNQYKLISKNYEPSLIFAKYQRKK